MRTLTIQAESQRQLEAVVANRDDALLRLARAEGGAAQDGARGMPALLAARTMDVERLAVQLEQERAAAAMLEQRVAEDEALHHAVLERTTVLEAELTELRGDADGGGGQAAKAVALLLRAETAEARVGRLEVAVAQHELVLTEAAEASASVSVRADGLRAGCAALRAELAVAAMAAGMVCTKLAFGKQQAGARWCSLSPARDAVVLTTKPGGGGRARRFPLADIRAVAAGRHSRCFEAAAAHGLGGAAVRPGLHLSVTMQCRSTTSSQIH
jgi:hypothetical protein